MKKKIYIYILIAILLFSSCSKKDNNANSTYENIKLPNALMTEQNIAYSEDGLYLLSDFGDLYYMEKDDDKFVFLNYLNYKDDKPIKMGEEGDIKNYSEYPFGNIIHYLDGNLYYLAEYRNVENVVNFNLYKLDKTGGNREKILTIKHEPYNFLFSNNHFISIELDKDNNSIVHIYDKDENEKIITFDKWLSSIYALDDSFIVIGDEYVDGVYMETLYRIYFDGTYEEIDKANGNFIFADKDKYILSEFIDNNDMDTISYIKDYDGNILTENKEINISYLDDKYYYGESKNMPMEYFRYTYDNELDSKISPYQKLGQIGEAVMIDQMDYDLIYRIVYGNTLTMQYDRGKGERIYILGNFDTGEFTVINNSNVYDED